MNIPRKAFLALAVSALMLAHAQARTWTNKEGKTVFASYVKLEADTVHMRLNNGRLAKVPMDKLSSKDQAWVRQRETDKAANPDPEKETTDKAPAIPPARSKPDFSFKDMGTTKFPAMRPIPPIREDARIPVDDWIGGHHFYMTKEGKDAFPHLKITNRIKPFSDGLAYVHVEQGKERLKGYINRSGQFVIGGDSGTPLPEGSTHSDFSEGLASFRKGKFAGYFDKTGKIVIAADTYFGAEPFSEGLAMVCTEVRKTWKFIDKTGKVVLEGKETPWLGGRPFKNGAAWVTVAFGSYQSPIRQLINQQGEVLVPGTFTTSSTSGQIIAHYTSIDSALYNTTGKKIIPEFSNGFLRAKSEHDHIGIFYGKNGLPNRLFHIPSQSLYGPELPYGFHSGNFSEGLIPFSASIRKKNRYGWIDRQGKVAIPPGFFEAAPFIEGFAVLRKAYGEDESDIRVVVVNRQGKIVWKGEARK